MKNIINAARSASKGGITIRSNPCSRCGLPIVVALLILVSPLSHAHSEPDPIQQSEAERIAVIDQIRPSVVAVFGKDAQGGGSGVLISEDGYALTNFHVIQGNPILKCGLPDGQLYDGVVVGIDAVGDVALIKLLPVEDGKPFSFSSMGDSDTVRQGDWTLAMGNPFLLATDFTPTVTYGIVSGTQRYQYPSGTILEYTDCIQVDTSINPGNSGGPLFNMSGEIIGINGRISLEKRGRVNSGVGYAISINQIKNFLGHLRGGLIVDHATLGAVVRTDAEGRMYVQRILENSDVYRRGLDLDDQILSFAGRPLSTVNQFKNVLGIYPAGWRLPMVFRHMEADGSSTRKEVLVRLMGVQPDLNMGGPPRPTPPGRPLPQPKSEPKKDSPAAKMFEAKDGFANYYFNNLERNRLWTAFQKHGDFSKASGPWKMNLQPMDGDVSEVVLSESSTQLAIKDLTYIVEPLKLGESMETLRQPTDSGGLLVALYHWRRLLHLGEKGFEGEYRYSGYEPFYPDGSAGSRMSTDVLVTEHGGVQCKWYFDRDRSHLIGLECFVEPDQDPCEIAFSDHKERDGRWLPGKIDVRFADKQYAAYTVSSFGVSAP